MIVFLLLDMLGTLDLELEEDITRVDCIIICLAMGVEE